MLAMKLIFAVMGLVFPGYLLSRTGRLSLGWLSAFPLSLLIMTELVILLDVVGMSLTFGNLACVGSLVFGGGCLLLRHLELAPLPEVPHDDEPPQWLPLLAGGTLVVLTLLVLFRGTLFPLSGFDTYFRWEGLARAMLEQRSLAFYPPQTSADFSIYVYPDGIPPLVATAYWWLYAACGQPIPAITSIVVAMQFVVLALLTRYAATVLFGRTSGWCAMLLVITAPLTLNGVAIAQETGYTAISVAGQLCFAGLALRTPSARLVVMAGLFAALGGLAREYGPALSLAGVVLFGWQRQGRRWIPLFVCVAALGMVPWYLRCWILTGNPFFPHALTGGSPHNAVYAAIMEYYGEYRSVVTFKAMQWVQLLVLLGGGGWMLVVAGGAFIFRCWRSVWPLGIVLLQVVFLWLYSIGKTAGGVTYSMRVLTPAFVILAICGGKGLGAIDVSGPYRRFLRYGLAIALAGTIGYAVVRAAAHPFPASALSKAFFSHASDPPEFCVTQPELVSRLNESSHPASGVLTDDMYLATLLQRRGRFRPVTIWSPEVSFLFVPGISASEARQRLLAQDVRLIAIENDSPNTAFMMRHAFFQDYRRWPLLFAVGDRGAVFRMSLEP